MGIQGSTGQAMAYALAALVMVCIAGFVVLAATGAPTDGYVQFVSGPAVLSLLGALIAQRAAVRGDAG